MHSWYTLLILLAFCVRPHDANSMTPGRGRARSADSLGKSLASLFLVKEGNVPAAKKSMSIFQKITQHHVLQNGQSIKAQQAQQLAQYSQDQIVEPTQQYLNETVAEHLQGLTPNFTAIAEAMQPDLAYFTDPSQNFISDYFQALTQAGTSIGSVQGPDFISSAPCLIGTMAQGVGIQASAINIIPQLFSITPTGVGIFPQGINIQPAIIYISPYGINISPIGLLIQPVLISITPIAESVNPQGVSVAPTLIAVATPANRRMLKAEDKKEEKEQSLGDVFLQSYEKWMGITANMVMKREATPEDAGTFLSDVFQQTDKHLDMFQSLQSLAAGIVNQQGAFNQTQDWEELAQEFTQLYPVEIMQSILNGSLNDPDFDVSSLLPSGVSFQDPMFFDDQGFNVSSTLQLIYVAPTGESVTPTGYAVGPNLISIQPIAHIVGTAAQSIGDTFIDINAKTGEVTVGGSGSGGGGAAAAASG
ncbi:g12419 [Coccomyxa viridis]|uniref:G12419 protein n=1 Tax=Coccomyxa viridis TaxID=1274662 RepID=A0ABP1GAA2_9CHLO